MKRLILFVMVGILTVAGLATSAFLYLFPHLTAERTDTLGIAEVIVPRTEPTGLVYLLSGGEGYGFWDRVKARRYAASGAVVVGIDTPATFAKAEKLPDDCVYFVSDVEQVSQNIQRVLDVDSYHSPVIAGSGLGGTFALALAAQSPDATIGRTIAVDPHAALPLRKELCSEARHVKAADGNGWVYELQKGHLPDPIDVYMTRNADPVGAAHVDELIGSGFAIATAKSVKGPGRTLDGALLEQLTSADDSGSPLAGIPITLVPAVPKHDTLAIIYSGDGGWRDIDAEIGGYLAKAGVPVVGIDSLRYFWNNVDPADAAGDLAKVIDTYAKKWNVHKVALDGLPVGSLGIAEATIPQNPFELRADEARNLGTALGITSEWWLGQYGEPRLVYTDKAFRKGRWLASNRRTIHMAVDVFAPAGEPVRAPLAGKVALAENREGHLDYGGVVILEHRTPAGDVFHTLYGHLAADGAAKLKQGQEIAAGEAFAKLGPAEENGGWEPHLHFQLALTLDGMGHDWPGVADPDDWALWQAICPNPAALLNLPDDVVAYQAIDEAALLAERKARFGANLKLSYKKPVTFLRGWRHHLFDAMGRPYLDAYNNVPHVGHAHPRIRKVAMDQLARMNSNTRYLHPAPMALAERLTAKLPKELEVCFFVNSGSEANELALRLARAASGGYDIVTPDHGYHGNTTGAIDISAYKFNKPNMGGRKPWVQLVDVADDYRGRFRRDDADRALHYAEQVDGALAAITERGGKVAGFIAETFPSVGGQIIPPPGYLAAVYERIRAAGGICIADEVQTGLGRLGDYYFGFEQQNVRPDIVVLGKPLGNGHPIGALITTRAIAERFAEGPEYFSTFGGSNLSCRIASEVLDIVEEEGLSANAKVMGDKLLAGMRDLAKDYPCVGDVRGIGLFLGLELVTDRETLEPATDAAAHVMNRLRDMRILVGREGPADNILKIRPPLTVGADDVEMILDRLKICLREVEAAR